jgi:hypothetical protein
MPALVSDGWGLGLIAALTWKEIPFLALVAFSILATTGRRGWRRRPARWGPGPWPPSGA